MDKKDISVVICCAAMDTRLGIGIPKALINIDNKPLIIHQLELLSDFDDIRIVVGYRAEDVIKEVNTYRKDIVYVFNYDYENTGSGASLYKALTGIRDYVLVMDGDLLINKEDFKKFTKSKDEVMAISKITTDEPLLIEVDNDKVISFNHNGNYEWPGIAIIKSNKITRKLEHISDIMKELLPMNSFILRTRDIDTQDDYERVEDWYKKGMKD